MSFIDLRDHGDSFVEHIHGESDAKQITDIGGGSGALLSAILEASPHIKGRLFDLPSVIERARDKPRNFFEAIPSGADILLLKHIIHDWEDTAREKSSAAVVKEWRETLVYC